MRCCIAWVLRRSCRFAGPMALAVTGNLGLDRRAAVGDQADFLLSKCSRSAVATAASSGNATA